MISEIFRKIKRLTVDIIYQLIGLNILEVKLNNFSSNPMCTGGKDWPGRDADHSPPCSAEVKNE
jgi:hypothetical protein